MNIIFMGTSSFAVPALDALYNSDNFVSVVFTKEPKKSGRGQKLSKSPVHIEAEKLGLNIVTPKNLKNKEILKKIEDIKPDIIVVAAYGHIIPKIILDIPRFGCINIHPSILPRWRGAAPVERAILTGDEETAVCIMQMDENLDTGDILLMQKVKLENDINSALLSKKLADIGSHMLIETIVNIENITPKKQSSEGVTYAEKIEKEEGCIDWSKPSTEIDRMVRAFYPKPGCFFFYQGEKIKLLEVEICNDEINGKPGEIIDNKFTICCSKGAIKPKLLQRPGKKAVAVADFINGLKIKPGTLLE